MARKTVVNTAERDLAELNAAREFLFDLFEKGYSPKDALAELRNQQAAARGEAAPKFARAAGREWQSGRAAKT